jgi:hypothetical protein
MNSGDRRALACGISDVSTNLGSMERRRVQCQEPSLLRAREGLSVRRRLHDALPKCDKDELDRLVLGTAIPSVRYSRSKCRRRWECIDTWLISTRFLR